MQVTQEWGVETLVRVTLTVPKVLPDKLGWHLRMLTVAGTPHIVTTALNRQLPGGFLETGPLRADDVSIHFRAIMAQEGKPDYIIFIDLSDLGIIHAEQQVLRIKIESELRRAYTGLFELGSIALPTPVTCMVAVTFNNELVATPHPQLNYTQGVLRD